MPPPPDQTPDKSGCPFGNRGAGGAGAAGFGCACPRPWAITADTEHKRKTKRQTAAFIGFVNGFVIESSGYCSAPFPFRASPAKIFLPSASVTFPRALARLVPSFAR